MPGDWHLRTVMTQGKGAHLVHGSKAEICAQYFLNRKRKMQLPSAFNADFACPMASHGDGMSRNTASAMFETPKPFLQTSWLVTVTRCSTPCSRNSSRAFSALCWWNSTVYRCPVGATVRMRAWERDPLPVPRKDKQLMKLILSVPNIRTKVFCVSLPAWNTSSKLTWTQATDSAAKREQSRLHKEGRTRWPRKQSSGSSKHSFKKSGKHRICPISLEQETNAKGQL